MRRTGILSIGLGISRLGFRRLMKGGLDNGGFRRATDFLEADRGLNSGETIWVDGTDATFAGESVIVITNAGRPTRAATASRDAQAATAARAERPSGGRKGAEKSASKKAGTKKAGTKKSGAKKSASKKSAAKKSAAKKPASKKSPAKGAKKSGAKKSGGGGKSAKRPAKKSTR